MRAVTVFVLVGLATASTVYAAMKDRAPDRNPFLYWGAIALGYSSIFGILYCASW